MIRAALIAILLIGLAAPAGASPLDDAFELHEQAIVARDAGEHERAERLFRQSLAATELNVTWLNLGQLYGLMGRCVEARDAFDRVADAAPVEAPSIETVMAVLAERRAELERRCPDEPQKDLTLEPAAARPHPRPSHVGPIVVMSVAGAGLVAGGIIDATVLAARFRRLDELQGAERAAFEDAARRTRTLQVANVTVLAVSGAALAGGLVWLWLTANDDAGVAIVPAPRGAAVVVRY